MNLIAYVECTLRMIVMTIRLISLRKFVSISFCFKWMSLKAGLNNTEQGGQVKKTILEKKELKFAHFRYDSNLILSLRIKRKKTKT